MNKIGVALIVLILLVVVAGMTIAVFFGGDAFILWLSRHDTLWSPYRLKAPGGQFFATAKGKSNGEFAGIYHSIRGVVLDKDHNFIEDMNAWQAEQDAMGYIEKELGVVWVGFFRKYYLAPVKYVAIDKIPKKTEFALVEKERNLTADDPYYYWQYLMAATTTAAEIQGNVQIDMLFLFTLRIQNGYKALFLAGKFPVRGTTAVERRSREFVRKMEFEQVKDLHGAGGGSIIAELHRLGDAPTNLREEFGLEVDNSEFLKFDPTPGNPEVEKSLTAEKVAQNNAKGITAIASAEADRLRLRYAAIANLPGAPAFAISEAIRDAKPGTVVIGDAALAITGK